MVKAEPTIYEETPKKRLKCAKIREDRCLLTLAQVACNTPSKCSLDVMKSYTNKKSFVKARRSSCVANKVQKVSINHSKRPASECNKRRDLSNRVYASDEARMRAKERAQELESNLENGFPSFVKLMLQSHVTGGFWLGLPTRFCREKLPKENATVTLVDESGKEWPTVYLPSKSGLSGGWRGFSIAHKLVDGDALVFELVKPKEFKVYIVRAYSQDVTEEAMGLLTWNSSSNLKGQNKTDEQIETSGETANLRPSLEEISRNDEDVICAEVLQEIKFSQKFTELKDAIEGVMGLLTWDSSPNLPSQSKQIETNGETAALQLSAEETFRNNNEEDGLEAFDGIRFSETTLEFKDVKDLESFNIIVDGLIIDSEFSENERTKYYELCRSQGAFLHVNLLEGLNLTLVAGTILETLNIADAIRTSKLTTTQADFAAWDKSLGALEKLGMNVGFLLARLQKLKIIASESEKDIDSFCSKIEHMDAKTSSRHELKFQ